MLKQFVQGKYGTIVPRVLSCPLTVMSRPTQAYCSRANIGCQ